MNKDILVVALGWNIGSLLAFFIFGSLISLMVNLVVVVCLTLIGLILRGANG